MMSSESPLAMHDTGPVIAPGARSVWRASALAIFLPTLVIAAGYSALSIFLHLGGRDTGALSRASMAVLVLGIPLLLVYAGLRLATTQMTLRGSQVEIHPGFPARDPILVGYRQIEAVVLKRGLSGFLTGAGSLIIDVKAGRPLVVSALQDPEAAMAAIRARCSLAVSGPLAVEEEL